MIGFKKGGSGVAGSAYYIHSAGMDDYYISDDPKKQKEPVGTWYNPSGKLPSPALFHNQKVDKESFRLLCRGRDTAGNKLTKTVDDKHTALYDITFNAPKSVSVLWGLALKHEPELAEKISAIQKAAVERTIQFISEKYALARVGGKGGRGVTFEHVELMGALWEHGSSRAGDMQLHTHFTALNMALISTGEYRTIDPAQILKNQIAAAAIYHNELASGLIDQLGVEIIKEDDKPIFEIAGIHEILISHFSKRGNVIQEYIEEMGGKANVSHAIKDKITIETKDKKTDVTRDELTDDWDEQVRALGFDPKIILGEVVKNAKRETLTNDDRQMISETVTTILTASRSVFAEADVYAMISRLTQGQLNADQLCDLADHMIKHDLVYLGEQDRRPFYSTEEMIKLEREMLDLGRSQDKKHHLALDPVETALAAHSSMSDEQKEAVRAATLTDNRVSIIEGAAGAGKSFTMGTIQKLYEDAGYKIEGLALSWSAAGVMSDESKIENARAIEGFCRDLEKGKVTLTNKTVVIVDEAGLVGSRHMHLIMQAVEDAGAKLILTGDSKQLNPVAAGGALAALVEEHGSARIDTVRRQGGHVRHDPEQYAAYQWQRDAVGKLADGHIDALDGYIEQGAVRLHDNHEAMVLTMVEDWYQHRQAHPDESSLLLANDNQTVRQLNALVREKLKKDGVIASEGMTLRTSDLQRASEAEFCVGDKIIFRKNDKEMNIQGDQSKAERKEGKGVYNRTSGTIIGIDMTDKGPVLRVELDKGGVVEIGAHPGGYWDNAKKGVPIQHAYATTIYASQGMTVHKTMLADSPLINRRLAYVGASRHMQELSIYSNKEALHGQLMQRKAADEWRNLDTFSNEELVQQLKKNWAREAEKTTTAEFIKAQQKLELERTQAADINKSHVETKLINNAEQSTAELGKDEKIQDRSLLDLDASKLEIKVNCDRIKDRSEAIERGVNAMSERTEKYLQYQQKVQAAKSVDLPQFLELQCGEKLEKDTASSYKLKMGEGEHPWLIFRSKAGNWLAHNGEDTRDAVGFVQERYGKTFKGAVAMINREAAPAEMQAQRPTPKKPENVQLRRSTPAASKAAFEYATEQRGISRETLLAARDQGFAKSDDRGVLFLGYDETGKIRCAETRCLAAVELKPGSWTTKVSSPGTDKTFAPVLKGENPADVHLVEGGFDALALHDMYRKMGEPTPTVIVTMGAKLTKFIDSPVVQQALDNAEQVTAWKDHEKNEEVKAKTDKGHENQLAAVTNYLYEQRSSAEVLVGTVPEGHKDLAEYNKAEGKPLAETAELHVYEREQELDRGFSPSM